MQYLARKSIPVVPGADKVKNVDANFCFVNFSFQVRLVKQIIDFWNTGNQTLTNENQSSIVSLATTNQLSLQFTEWFFTAWNNLKNFSSDHFFPDCQLTLVHENNRRILGAFYVCDLLRSYIANQELVFYPNVSSNKAEESRHGLVVVQIHGTIHQRGTCVGIFDQAFGLTRDPTHGNNYLIKFIFLNMQTQSGQAQLQLPSHTAPTPSFLVEIMENYDQTIQKEIDATDYVIDEGDDESDDQ